MSLFSFFNGLDKPGRGVSKTEKKRTGIPLFFQTVGRKWRKLILLNLMYLLFSLPAFILWFILSGFVCAQLPLGFSEEMYIAGNIMFSLIISVSFIMIFGSGPAAMAMHGILCNFLNEEPVWLWSDFLEYIKKYFKTGMSVFIIDTAIIFILIEVWILYGAVQMIVDMRIAVMVFAILYAMSRTYLYPMLVRGITLKTAFKTMFICAIANLPQSICVMLVFFLFCFCPLLAIRYMDSGVFVLMISVVLMVLISFTFTSLYADTNAKKQLDKLIR